MGLLGPWLPLPGCHFGRTCPLQPFPVLSLPVEAWAHLLNILSFRAADSLRVQVAGIRTGERAGHGHHGARKG